MIAIHSRQGSFSDRWVEYCLKNDLEFKLVNAYDSDILKQLENCNAFMWHHYSDSDYREALFANQLILSVEIMGLKVFPNFSTSWFFNDKIAQKYLLEAIGAPFVKSYVFYTKKEALTWVNETVFPKVFKLRSGAGSLNVKLINTKNQAQKIINKAFGNGFPQLDRFEYFKDKYQKWKDGKGLIELFKGFGRFVFSSEFSKMYHKEKGYAFFQDFVPNNNFDIRVVIVGNKAFALKRFVKKGDFRASGSGYIIYNKEEIDIRCVKISFEVNNKIKAQSIAFDYIFDEYNNPLIVEISYGFAMTAYDNCEGFWDDNLNWFSGNNFNFCGWMVDCIK